MRVATQVVDMAVELHAVTLGERRAATVALREAFVRSSGFILDVHLFSNVSLNVEFEIPKVHVRALILRLDAARIKLDAESRTRLFGVGTTPVSGTLEVTFLNPEPELRREIPKVPG
jgi:hypothetical protein